MMDRRDFLIALGAGAGAAAGMAVSRLTGSWDKAFAPVLYGDGVHDDAPALNAWVRGERVWDAHNREWLTSRVLEGGEYHVCSTIDLTQAGPGGLLRGNTFIGAGADPVVKVGNTRSIDGICVVMPPFNTAQSAIHLT